MNNNRITITYDADQQLFKFINRWLEKQYDIFNEVSEYYEPMVYIMRKHDIDYSYQNSSFTLDSQLLSYIVLQSNQ